MKQRGRGERFYGTIHAFMPRFFEYINPVIHQLKTEQIQLNENQVKIIMAVIHLKEATPTLLSKCYSIQKGSLTTMIRSLVKMGLLNKRPHESDERKYILSVTEKAEAIIEHKEADNIQQFDELLKDMPAEEFNKVTRGFEALCNYLQRLGEPE